MDYHKAVVDIETSLAKSGMAPSLKKCVMDKALIMNALICGIVSGVYFYGIAENNVHILCICILATIQMVFTVGAAAEAAVASVFIAIACNPVAFARLHPLLIKDIWSLDSEIPEVLNLVSRAV